MIQASFIWFSLIPISRHMDNNNGKCHKASFKDYLSNNMDSLYMVNLPMDNLIRDMDSQLRVSMVNKDKLHIHNTLLNLLLNNILLHNNIKHLLNNIKLRLNNISHKYSLPKASHNNHLAHTLNRTKLDRITITLV